MVNPAVVSALDAVGTVLIRAFVATQPVLLVVSGVMHLVDAVVKARRHPAEADAHSAPPPRN